MSGVPRVALLVETSRRYGRDVLRGVVRYARLHGPWAFYVTPGDFVQVLPKMEQWGGTGIIARIETPQIAKAVLDSGLPFVALDLSESQLAPGSPLADVCHLSSDSEGAATLAAEHLLNRGFQNFGFVGLAGRIWSKRRQEAFCGRLQAAGHKAHVYRGAARRQEHWSREQAALARWLSELPKPAGVMACNDDRGREVLEACRTAEVRVPEDVSVIGVDNDELLCELSDPTLTSVELGAERAGFEAAAVLDQLMEGRLKRPRRIVARALAVVVRRSTDVMLHEDPEVAAALRFINDNAGRPIRVEDVAAELGMSRRALEVRFRGALGRSIHPEIRRAHLERAKSLLLETDLSIPKVARASGYGSPSYLAVSFRRALGMSPLQFRANNRKQ